MSLKATFFGYSLALYYGFLAVFVVLWDWVKNPRKTIFTVKERPTPPLCLTDPGNGSHGYLSVNGIKIHYVEKGDKSKQLMLFLHGFPEFWYSWRYQIQEFSKDYWTVAIDMRGYSDSDKPVGVHNYEIKHLISDVAGTIKALGRQKCILVSHDWGGAVGWGMLKVHPDMIDRYIVMNAPPGGVFNKLLATDKKQFRKSWYMFFFQLPFLPELFLRLDDLKIFDDVFKKKSKKEPIITNEDIEAFKYTYSKPGAFSGPLCYYKAVIRGATSAKLKPMHVEDPPRGLFIFGEEDDYLEPVLVEMAQKSIKNLSVKIVNDANHFVQQDEPAIVNKLMRDFLNEK